MSQLHRQVVSRATEVKPNPRLHPVWTVGFALGLVLLVTFFAQLDHWMVDAPVSSPDGKWLLVSVVNTDSYNGFEGTVQQWVP